MSVNVNPIMAAIVEAAETLNTAPDDYINPDDGLKYCGKCHTPKEAYFPEQYRKNGLDKHPVACKCAAEERARREAEQRELERLNRIAMLRSEAFRDIPAAGWRFENAEVMTPQLVKARRYSENWDAFRQDGTGLLLFGNVGTGKSYAAGCIANALIEKNGFRPVCRAVRCGEPDAGQLRRGPGCLPENADAPGAADFG